jgi:hypothetical protein
MQNIVGNFSRTPGKIRHAGPVLGSSNRDILVDQLGFSKEELRQAGYEIE